MSNALGVRSAGPRQIVGIALVGPAMPLSANPVITTAAQGLEAELASASAMAALGSFFDLPEAGSSVPWCFVAGTLAGVALPAEWSDCARVVRPGGWSGDMGQKKAGVLIAIARAAPFCSAATIECPPLSRIRISAGQQPLAVPVLVGAGLMEEPILRAA